MFWVSIEMSGPCWLEGKGERKEQVNWRKSLKQSREKISKSESHKITRIFWPSRKVFLFNFPVFLMHRQEGSELNRLQIIFKTGHPSHFSEMLVSCFIEFLHGIHHKYRKITIQAPTTPCTDTNESRKRIRRISCWPLPGFIENACSSRELSQPDQFLSISTPGKMSFPGDLGLTIWFSSRQVFINMEFRGA